MFVVKELSKTIQLAPAFFSPNVKDYLIELLYSSVEGSCNGHTGYIISVVSIESISEGVIAEDGSAKFDINYTAIVFRPFRGEVLDGAVSSVNKMGIFVDVGPMQCFISSHLISSEFVFEHNATPPCFISREDELKIEMGTKIRLRVVGTRIDATEVFAVGTIKEDFLGPLT